MTAPDPLVEAIVRLLTRHHNGCDHPVQPAPWMRNAATEIADTMRHVGWSPYPDDVEPDLLVLIHDLLIELDRRADA